MAKNYILGIILSRVLALLLFKGFLFSPFYTLPNTHIDGGRELRLGGEWWLQDRELKGKQGTESVFPLAIEQLKMLLQTTSPFYL